MSVHALASQQPTSHSPWDMNSNSAKAAQKIQPFLSRGILDLIRVILHQRFGKACFAELKLEQLSNPFNCWFNMI